MISVFCASYDLHEFRENRPTSGRNCRELLQGAIELIRFPLMPLNELTELTRIREILTSEVR